jgi:hypothetical protein
VHHLPVSTFADSHLVTGEEFCAFGFRGVLAHRKCRCAVPSRSSMMVTPLVWTRARRDGRSGAGVFVIVELDVIIEAPSKRI